MALKIEDLKPTPGSRKNKIRVGRGPGSTKGKTAGKGHKGQKARSGGGARVGFEGGQTPIYMRSPKKGFKNFTHKVYAEVNLDTLERRYDANEEVSVESLLEKKVIRKVLDGVKILGNGTLSKPLKVRAHAFSKSAQSKIEEAGGSVEVM
ncbi:MAG TPA: 50S ribosomal protein L15 [Thermotogota bacterium]|mgnify:CR=1 FL=1|nr:50S ribosomal protein L15 [Thermotogota bacterium]HRW91357.1 50S ribosomal protein L15 [Thermotogota bacterium]